MLELPEGVLGPRDSVFGLPDGVHKSSLQWSASLLTTLPVPQQVTGRQNDRDDAVFVSSKGE